ncbi:MAG: PCRF domain-containing protein [Terriglobia bacterium]
MGSSAWQSDKQAALALISSPDFWNSAERFVVLGKVEYLDRIESGFESAGSLLRRLAGNRAHYPRDLVQRLAQQLYLLDRASSSLKAQEPSDTFLLIQAGRDSGETAVLTDDFARRLGGMYRTWAKKRHMQTQVLEESAGDGKTPYRLLLALSGFAAFAILRLEDGLHVLEIPDPGDKSFKRYRVQVRILPQPHNPAGPGSEALRRQALETYDTAGSPNLNIVRRYRELPSPLVRDSVRGWRTGRLDRVFEGDFDLIVDKDREP